MVHQQAFAKKGWKPRSRAALYKHIIVMLLLTYNISYDSPTFTTVFTIIAMSTSLSTFCFKLGHLTMNLEVHNTSLMENM